MARKTKKGKFKRIVLWLLLAVIIIFTPYSVFVEPKELQVKDYTISSKDIPANFSGKKIIFFSDIHYNFGLTDLDAIVAKINSENPDIVIIGGDMINRNPKQIEGCVDKLIKLNAKLGVYAVLGNHDNKHGIANSLIKELRKTEIKLIENSSFWVSEGNQRIKIGGVGDYKTGVQRLKNTTNDVSTDDFVVLASHSPDYFPEIDSDKIDLVLSGHLHGGQVGFFGWYPAIPSKYGNRYRTGEISDGSKTLIVSNGVGETFLPLRFMAKPDIVSVILQSQS